ncbi:DNA repair protein [Trypanosoma grayi]|uniref:DNA repair protein n=1 Tax=Trypanosoma grayi TaxID=71804 RepID=UPI0004F43FE5|nr:DNA repair protein [Trypanosoma grayi]KEG14909.1 DNA repair protein [Trypanosoma grayi]
MGSIEAGTPLATRIERLVPRLQEDAMEHALAGALLRCCVEWGIASEAELLLLLTSDRPFVQRRVLLAVAQDQRQQTFCHPAEVQIFIEKLLLALSMQHLSQKFTSVVDTDIDTDPSFMPRSVADMLLPAPAVADGSTPSTAAREGSHFFTTGCPSLDQLFGGAGCRPGTSSAESGIRAGLLTEIYGEAGSGKTQLALQCLLHCVAHHQCALLDPTGAGREGCVSVSTTGVAALYIASEDFPASRLASLAAGAVKREKQKALRAVSHLPSSTLAQLKASLDAAVTVKSVMAGLHIRCIKSLKILLRLLSDGTLTGAFHALGGRGIVVVDSIAGAAAAAGAGASGPINGSGENDRWEMASDLVAVGSLLKAFAVQEVAAVLVTNQVRSLLSVGRLQRHATDIVVPALGIQWSLAPHVRVHLRRLHAASGTVRRQLTVLYGPAHPPTCGVYVIESDGIRDDT